MYELWKKFLTTYDPYYLEQHTDSSDFEGSCSSVISPKKEYHRLRMKVHSTRSKEEKDFLNKQIFDQKYSELYSQSSRELWHTEAIVSRDTTEVDLQVRQRSDDKTLKDRNEFQTPSNNVKQMSIIKENQYQNVHVDNGFQCQECRLKITKFNRRQQHQGAHPVYAVRGIYGGSMPFGNDKITQSQLSSNVKSYNHSYSNDYDFADSEQEMIESKKKRRKWKKAMSETKKQRSKLTENSLQQFPTKKAWKSPYPFFTIPYQYHTTDAACLAKCPENPRDVIMASTSSGFWEYLLEKFNKKPHADKTEICQRCGRKEPAAPKLNESAAPKSKEPASMCRGCPDFCEFIPRVEPETEQGQEESNESCNCSLNSAPAQKPVKPPKKSKVQCMCAKKKAKETPPQKPVPTPDPSPGGVCCKCQQPHEPLVHAVAAKYNGEVLCIHNPPCILINGCLNLPAPKQEKQMEVWPMTEDRNSCHGQSSQYPPPFYDVHQCQIPEQRHEKIVQSLCSHNPPCEVVRTCVKPKYDPMLHNPCIHVPTCEKIPECLMDRENDGAKCSHKPKCLELPVCTRNYLTLTANQDMAVQAKPVDLTCRHEPPCELVPKCLAQDLCDSCMPHDSTDCVHQPMCEMIPACCRKSTKEMITSSCQGSIVEEKPVHYKNKLLRIMRRTKMK